MSKLVGTLAVTLALSFALIVALLFLWWNAIGELGHSERALTDAQAAYANASAEIESRGQENSVLRDESANLSAAFANLDAEHEILAGRNASLEQELRKVRTDLQRTETYLNQSRKQVQTLQEKNEELQSITDTSTSLESLNAEVERLEDRLQPLLLRERTVTKSGFLCTASMEPTITCLDEAEWVGEFEPSEIVVGTVITFDPDCDEVEPNGQGTTHRVAKVKVENGIYYFWPRGDGNREDDGCWIPSDQVNGYLIALHEDTFPENESIRESVLYAKAAYYASLDAWEPALAQYEALWAQYCGDQSEDTCTLAEPAYSIVFAEYERVEALRQEVLKTSRAFECWLGRAHWGLSQYRPQFIPIDCL